MDAAARHVSHAAATAGTLQPLMGGLSSSLVAAAGEGLGFQAGRGVGRMKGGVAKPRWRGGEQSPSVAWGTKGGGCGGVRADADGADADRADAHRLEDEGWSGKRPQMEAAAGAAAAAAAATGSIVPSVQESEIVFQGFVSVRKDTLLWPSRKGAAADADDGGVGAAADEGGCDCSSRQQEYLSVFAKPKAAIIIAATSDGRLVLTREYRHAVGAYVLSAPGGVVEGSEAPEEVSSPSSSSSSSSPASRELLEETGFSVRDPRCLGSIFALPGLWSQELYVVVGDDAEEVSLPSREDGEMMQLCLMGMKDVELAVRASEPVDGSLLAALWMLRLWKDDVRERSDIA